MPSPQLVTTQSRAIALARSLVVSVLPVPAGPGRFPGDVRGVGRPTTTILGFSSRCSVASWWRREREMSKNERVSNGLVSFLELLAVATGHCPGCVVFVRGLNLKFQVSTHVWLSEGTRPTICETDNGLPGQIIECSSRCYQWFGPTCPTPWIRTIDTEVGTRTRVSSNLRFVLKTPPEYSW